MTYSFPKSIIVTPRDEKLFQFLFVNKVATVQDIALDIFQGTSIKTIHRRLVKLSKEKLIEASAQREFGNRMVYSLTKKGLIHYVADDKSLRRTQLKSDSINHDLTLLSIKRRLRKCDNVKGIYSENLYQSGILDDDERVKKLREVRPDAIVKLEINNQFLYLPLELEVSAKYSSRYEKLVSKYYLSQHTFAVLYISKTKAIQSKIQGKEIKKSKDTRQKFYYQLLENVLDESQKLSFINQQKEELSIY